MHQPKRWKVAVIEQARLDQLKGHGTTFFQPYHTIQMCVNITFYEECHVEQEMPSNVTADEKLLSLKRR